MEVIVSGKNVILTDEIQRYAADKIQRLARFEPKLDRVNVEITLQATRDVENHYVVQANLLGAGRLLMRGEVHAAEPKVAIDTLVDTLEERFQRLHDELETERYPTHGHLPPTPLEAFAEPSVLDRVLGDYGIDEAIIGRLKQHGIYTMEQLRNIVDDGRLSTWLGPDYRRYARKIVRVVEQLKL
jgi:ribosomal subunit interface protein